MDDVSEPVLLGAAAVVPLLVLIATVVVVHIHDRHVRKQHPSVVRHG
jgi:hypothetical protein